MKWVVTATRWSRYLNSLACPSGRLGRPAGKADKLAGAEHQLDAHCSGGLCWPQGRHAMLLPILFAMERRTARSDLVTLPVGLDFRRGFVYEVSHSDQCANLSDEIGERLARSDCGLQPARLWTHAAPRMTCIVSIALFGWLGRRNRFG